MFKLVFAGIATFIGLIVLLLTAVTIDETERGVLLKFGQVQHTLEPGFHLVNPFTQSVVKMDVSVQALEAIELTYSADAQIVEATVVVNYQLNSGGVEAIYSEVQRESEQRYVIPRTSDAVKNVLANYTAQGILDNRNAIPGEIKTALQLAVQDNNITVTGVSVTNFDFDDEYERAVQKKQVQEQEALSQANITAQEEEKKKQQILKAEALAEKTRLEVQALNQGGDDIIEKIKAEAQLELAKKWNGQMPTHMYAGSPFPVINIAQ